MAKQKGKAHIVAESPGIGLYRESALHAALKARYAKKGDRIEAMVDGSCVDIVRGELLIEIQTRSFSSIAPKLRRLVHEHPILLVHPIAVEKRILTLAADGIEIIRERKSPKRESELDLFAELVSLPELCAAPGFEIELAFVRRVEKRADDGKGSWRRKGISIVGHELQEIIGFKRFNGIGDYAALLPPSLPERFTNSDITDKLGGQRKRAIAQKMSYCLARMGAIAKVGKRGREIEYKRLI